MFFKHLNANLLFPIQFWTTYNRTLLQHYKLCYNEFICKILIYIVKVVLEFVHEIACNLRICFRSIFVARLSVRRKLFFSQQLEYNLWGTFQRCSQVYIMQSDKSMPNVFFGWKFCAFSILSFHPFGICLPLLSYFHLFLFIDRSDENILNIKWSTVLFKWMGNIDIIETLFWHSHYCQFSYKRVEKTKANKIMNVF